MRYQHIAVDGPIGSGKTTLVRMLARDFGGTALYEQSDKNPFLQEFYKDMKRYAFATQLYFLLSRYKNLEALRQMNLFEQPVVCDYTFVKDFIFAEINLSPEEAELYKTVYDLLHVRLPNPDLIIYLRADPKVLFHRIRKRGVGYEASIPLSYIEQLVAAYDKVYLHYNKGPLLVVDTASMDYESRVADYNLLKREIENHRGGVVHLVAK